MDRIKKLEYRLSMKKTVNFVCFCCKMYKNKMLTSNRKIIKSLIRTGT